MNLSGCSLDFNDGYGLYLSPRFTHYSMRCFHEPSALFNWHVGQTFNILFWLYYYCYHICTFYTPMYISTSIHLACPWSSDIMKTWVTFCGLCGTHKCMASELRAGVIRCVILLVFSVSWHNAELCICLVPNFPTLWYFRPIDVFYKLATLKIHINRMHVGMVCQRNQLFFG